MCDEAEDEEAIQGGGEDDDDNDGKVDATEIGRPAGDTDSVAAYEVVFK